MSTILVVMPIYNKEEFLEGAIESILQQTYKNVELVLVDDCSTDKSLEIAKSYEHLNNVTVLSTPKNRGCYYAFNVGLQYASSKPWDYFTGHGADDLSDITRFEKLIPLFEDPNLLGLKTTYVRVNRDHEPQLTRNGDKIDVYAGEGIAIFSRKVFTKLGYFDNIRFSGDTDYWWRLEAYCNSHPEFRVDSSNDILYLAIKHENNLTTLYNFTSDRPKYFAKSIEDIKQMVSADNFYRDIFE